MSHYIKELISRVNTPSAQAITQSLSQLSTGLLASNSPSKNLNNHNAYNRALFTLSPQCAAILFDLHPSLENNVQVQQVPVELQTAVPLAADLQAAERQAREQQAAELRTAELQAKIHAETQAKLQAEAQAKLQAEIQAQIQSAVAELVKKREEELSKQKQELTTRIAAIQTEQEKLNNQQKRFNSMQQEAERKYAEDKERLLLATQKQKDAEAVAQKAREEYEAKLKADEVEKAKAFVEMAEREIKKLKLEKKKEKEEQEAKLKSDHKNFIDAPAPDLKVIAEQKRKYTKRELLIQALEKIIDNQRRIINAKPSYTGDVKAYAKVASFAELESLIKTFPSATDPILCPLLLSVDKAKNPYSITLQELSKLSGINSNSLFSTTLTVQVHDFDQKNMLEQRMSYVLEGFNELANNGSSANKENVNPNKTKERELAIGMSKNNKPIVVHFTMRDEGIDITDAHEGNGDEYNAAVSGHRGVFLTASRKEITNHIYYTIKFAK